MRLCVFEIFKQWIFRNKAQTLAMKRASMKASLTSRRCNRVTVLVINKYRGVRQRANSLLTPTRV